jgi:hypothetical protein
MGGERRSAGRGADRRRCWSGCCRAIRCPTSPASHRPGSPSAKATSRWPIVVHLGDLTQAATRRAAWRGDRTSRPTGCAPHCRRAEIAPQPRARLRPRRQASAEVGELRAALVPHRDVAGELRTAVDAARRRDRASCRARHSRGDAASCARAGLRRRPSRASGGSPWSGWKIARKRLRAAPVIRDLQGAAFQRRAARSPSPVDAGAVPVDEAGGVHDRLGDLAAPRPGAPSAAARAILGRRDRRRRAAVRPTGCPPFPACAVPRIRRQQVRRHRQRQRVRRPSWRCRARGRKFDDRGDRARVDDRGRGGAQQRRGGAGDADHADDVDVERGCHSSSSLASTPPCRSRVVDQHVRPSSAPTAARMDASSVTS